MKNSIPRSRPDTRPTSTENTNPPSRTGPNPSPQRRMILLGFSILSIHCLLSTLAILKPLAPSGTVTTMTSPFLTTARAAGTPITTPPRTMAALIRATDLTPEELASVTQEATGGRTTEHVVSAVPVVVRTEGFVDFRSGQLLRPGDSVPLGLLLNLGQEGRFSIADSDEEVPLAKFGWIAVGISAETPSPGANTCSVTCGTGYYACCLYGTGGYPVCRCVATGVVPAPSCAAGGAGSVNCLLNQGGNAPVSNPTKLAPQEHTDQ